MLPFLKNIGCELSLKLANLHIDLGEVVEAKMLYDDTLTSFSAQISELESRGASNDEVYKVLRIRKAWGLIHRVALWINRFDLFCHSIAQPKSNITYQRDENGKIPSTAITDSLNDLNEALELTHEASTEEEKGCRLIVLLKIIHVMSQTKTQMGIPMTEADNKVVADLIEQAADLCPNHDLVLMMKIDMCSLDGRVEDALKKCDELAKSRYFSSRCLCCCYD